MCILSRAGLALSEHGCPPAQPADAQGRCSVNSALNAGSYSGFLYVLTRQTGLLDPGMLVNIQQPLIREDGTVLLATDCKVTSRSHPYPLLSPRRHCSRPSGCGVGALLGSVPLVQPCSGLLTVTARWELPFDLADALGPLLRSLPR